jgi:16S rRNA processing protein RimM
VICLQTYFNVGKIVNTHGINGEVRVISVTDFPEQRYQKGATLYLFLQNAKEPISLTIKNWRRHKNFDLLQFEGYTNINEVEKFKGGLLKIAADQLDRLEENEYYFHEIIGCTVKGPDEKEYGIITEILTPGANDVWVIKGKDHKEYYLPYIEEIVKKVDVNEKVVWIEPMEGLFD